MRQALSALLLAGLMASSGLAAATPAAAAGWLDAPLVRWNGPHQGVPRPPVQTNTRTGQTLNPADAWPAACFLQGRAPVTEEEKLVAGAGWLLRTYWPTLQWSDVTVITAPSWFDGMCRPAAYQSFTFVGGRFTGTLSPVPMTSRLDGSLFGGPDLKPGPVIEASFLRYAESDPLCCPSLPKVSVRYELVAEEGGRFFTPTSTLTLPLPVTPPAVPMQPSVPSRLPNTGDITGEVASLGLVLGVLSVVVAVGMRRRAEREAASIRQRSDGLRTQTRRRFE